MGFTNAHEYDLYVIQRTDELVKSGTPRRDAERTAQHDATQRFGPRTTLQGTQSQTWTLWPKRSEAITHDELADAVADMKKTGRK